MSLGLGKFTAENGLRVAYITWNIANSVPTLDEVKKLLEQHDGEVDAPSVI